MKRLLLSLIRQLGCMTILLLLIGLFFAISEKQDTAALFYIPGLGAGLIYIFSSLIYWYMDPGSF